MVVARNVCIILLCIVVVNSLEAEYEFRRDDGHDAASVNVSTIFSIRYIYPSRENSPKKNYDLSVIFCFFHSMS